MLRGHSGIFVDRAKFHISSSIVSANHLTGLSMVGDGAHAIVENTTITGNATIAIDAAHEKLELRGANVISNISSLQSPENITAMSP